MKYCYHCGTKLIEKYLKNEGMIPYCETCKQYVFPIFSTACSMIVLNPTKDKILLIKQYGKDRYVLVAGYINKGEDAESTVKREVKEEMGLEVDELEFNQSQYFPPSNTLMINFSCVAKSEDFTMNEEVDEAKWMSIEEVYDMIAKNSLAQSFLKHYLDNHKKDRK